MITKFRMWLADWISGGIRGDIDFWREKALSEEQEWSYCEVRASYYRATLRQIIAEPDRAVEIAKGALE